MTREALVRRLIPPEELPDQGPAPTRSELERRMLRLITRAGLPRPKVNHPLGPYVIDFAWPEECLLVETDGYAAHGHRGAFESDRARDADLQALGYAVLRFTWRQVSDEPLAVVARLARSLAYATARSPRASNSSA